MPRAAFLLSAEAFASVYTEAVRARLRDHVQLGPIVAPPGDWREHRAALAPAEIIFSGWGAPVMSEEFLRALPELKVIFYAGGSVRYFATDALWSRGIRLTTAAAVNAIPVCEYTASAILLGLKRFWHYARMTREQRTFPTARPLPGGYHATVGLVSYGTIARLVRQQLRAHDIHVLAYDPYLSEEAARLEHVRKVGLTELFAACDVVSVHTPLLPETIALIRGEHLARMKPDALFINTARGEIVHEPEMIATLRRRPDLQALLDVTAPEPPRADSPLYTLPNVILTPHIAGSVGPECERMGHAMADELERYIDGQPLRWEVTPGRAALMT
jgi:phosphoglycerate dehydrogenase-like enzyme